MSKNLLLIDIDKCVECHTCEVACKQEHNLPVGPRWIRIERVGPRKVEGEVLVDYVPTLCLQCDDPACARGCPTDCIVKRPDGIVTIDQDACNGCGLCVEACEYGVMQLDPVAGVAGKCDQCAHRQTLGDEPVCVRHCLSSAIYFGTDSEIRWLTEGRHTSRAGQVIYASSRWALNPI